MKCLLALSFLFFLSAKAEVKKVPVEFARIEPRGKKAMLKVEGHLPNGCYSEPRIEADKISSGLLRAFAVSDVEGEICPEMIRRYSLKVLLGPLRPGDHSLLLQEDTPWERILTFEISR